MTNFPATSLTNPTVVRRVLKHIKQDPKVRADAFRAIAHNPKLQIEILALYARHLKAQRSLVTELSTQPHMRRTILKIAGQNS